jgi:hypothetical protein
LRTFAAAATIIAAALVAANWNARFMLAGSFDLHRGIHRMDVDGWIESKASLPADQRPAGWLEDNPGFSDCAAMTLSSSDSLRNLYEKGCCPRHRLPMFRGSALFHNHAFDVSSSFFSSGKLGPDAKDLSLRRDAGRPAKGRQMKVAIKGTFQVDSG